jgi:hypothetical protein
MSYSTSSTGIRQIVRRCLFLRDDLCRECERPVCGWFRVCPHCGVGYPVKIPRCATLFILGMTIPQLMIIMRYVSTSS